MEKLEINDYFIEKNDYLIIKSVDGTKVEYVIYNRVLFTKEQNFAFEQS